MVFLDFEDSVTFEHAAMPRLHGEGAATKQSLEKLARSWEETCQGRGRHVAVSENRVPPIIAI